MTEEPRMNAGDRRSGHIPSNALVRSAVFGVIYGSSAFRPPWRVGPLYFAVRYSTAK
jgi:hypothetical protein